MKLLKLCREKIYLVGFLVALVIMSIVGINFLTSQRALSDSIHWRSHSKDVLVELERLQVSLADMQSGDRGYTLTGGEGYLRKYRAEISVIQQRIAKVRELTLDNAAQQKRIRQLEAVAGEYLQFVQTIFDARKGQGFEAARTLVSTGNGDRLAERIRGLVADMEDEEQALLQLREKNLKADLARVSGTMALWGMIAAGIILWAAVVTHRTINALKDAMAKNRETEWVQTSLARLALLMQGQRDRQLMTERVLSELAPLLDAQQGAIYLAQTELKESCLVFLSGYACAATDHSRREWKLGQGLVGQCAADKRRILITEVPPGYLRISSGAGEARPASIVLLPILFEDRLLGVLELASFRRFTPCQIAFLDQLVVGLGLVLNAIASNVRTEALLENSQSLTEELRVQQEELQQTNAELHSQTEALRQSQDSLREQQAELEAANKTLGIHAAALQAQRLAVEAKNAELEETQRELSQRAEQLALTSKFKSEFLANMSHELRTPLNSLLLLSRLLAENKDANLTPKQLQYVQTIHSGGNALLSLINEILDLSRIEAGRMAIHPEGVRFADLKASLERNFRALADQKALSFEIELGGGLPPSMLTDGQRLEQILRNLLANAFKFTARGGVTVSIRPAPPVRTFASEVLRRSEDIIAFAVQDTGIGIAPEKQRLVWEAFQQADGSTSRKYGGTGLGLTISREIARLLGGELHLESQEGQGSTFTLYLPWRYQETGPELKADGKIELLPSPPYDPRGARADLRETGPELDPPELAILDDRYEVTSEERAILIVEDDVSFARLLVELAHENGFKALVATRGDTGLALAHEFKPDAIILDLNLPGMSGWSVLERLKGHAELRPIPVHIISVEDERQRCLQEGAHGYLTKPVTKEGLQEAFGKFKLLAERQIARLLVVEDNDTEREEIIRVITDRDAVCTGVATGEAAMAALREERFDSLILDLHLPDLSGFDLLDQMHAERTLQDVPVIVYTSRTLSPTEESRLQRYVHAIVVKGPNAPARLLDETALFLHRVESRLQPEKQRMLREASPPDAVLNSREVLIVDDDLRNVFATTSVLESHQMKVSYAENGRAALEALDANPNISAVLMDIMMPEMDGYEAMREIRKNPRFAELPIIALTAKAMTGDREKCLAAGASDYLSKPVDMDRLLSLLRVWLYRPVRA